ncbi:hypothetical protein GCM10022380_07980 [Amycolatopsis tucumanensis]|uniref:Uncharacterized protein n=1 Tax=Amycolatopsis tucumanensis TaxID=401106 RepID=A0ABP7HJP4_9PSEU
MVYSHSAVAATPSSGAAATPDRSDQQGGRLTSGEPPAIRPTPRRLKWTDLMLKQLSPQVLAG